ncbi:hypothetical protein [Modestobacter sp. I12A-02662]|uniref:hypothetical protein n=1 Tax=Modestobacter sp. I12A-02662 TaxID=1730496 RepID=UPI0034E02764
MQAARSGSLAGPVVTLALAGSAALVLGAGDAIGFRSAGAEALLTIAWLLGWTLLAWATVLGGVCAVGLVRRLVAWRGAAWSEVSLVVVGAAVIVAVISTHPLWGSGSGAG